MKAPFVRQCFHGELWWSWLARNQELVGRGIPAIDHQQLVDNKRTLGSPLFPRQIRAILDSTGCRLSHDGVIQGHTLVPLYATFLDCRKVQKAKIAMVDNGNVEFALGLAAMRDYPTVLLACSDCMQEDREKLGAAFWRTGHQAPGSFFCSRHEKPLTASTVSARAEKQVVHLVTADTARFLRRPRIPRKLHDDLLWIARANSDILEKSPLAPGAARLTALYRRYLRNSELIDDFDRLEYRSFINRFNRRMTPLLSLLRYETPDLDARDNWLARLARFPRSEQSPLKHLLLMLFLGLNPIPAIEEAHSLQPCCAPLSLCAPAPVRTRRITEDKVQLFRTAWLALRAKHLAGSLRHKADRIYSWLWRSDRSWLRYYARSAAKVD